MTDDDDCNPRIRAPVKGPYGVGAMKTISERLRGPIKHPQQLMSQRIEAADSIDELVATLTELRSRYQGLFNVYVGRSYHSKADAQDDLDLALTGADTVLAKHK